MESHTRNSDSSSPAVLPEDSSANKPMSEELFGEIERTLNDEAVNGDMPFEVDQSKGESSAVKQPMLKEFFAEDRFGGDVDGKAFFEQVAAENGNEENGVKLEETVDRVLYESCDEVLCSEGEDTSLLPPNCNLDEIYDAWIPSEKTQSVLSSVMSSPTRTFHQDTESMTKPRVIILEEMKDPLKMLLEEINPLLVHQRKVFTAESVSADDEGLKLLIEADCYHAAINLITRLLLSLVDKELGVVLPSPKSLQLWFIRIALFMKLKKFSFAQMESEAFCDFDNADLWYEFYPSVYPSRRGSMVPFSFRLIVAELPQYLSEPQTALNKLYNLQHTIQKIIANLNNGLSEDGRACELSDDRKKASLVLWRHRECRVLYSILNCVLSQRDYVTSISVAEILMEKDEQHVVQLYSALGRIYLQLGDMKEAKDCFKRASTHPLRNANRVTPLIDKALLAMSLGENEEAYKYYQEALKMQPDNPMLTNNMSVCLLYMGRLKASLALLEQAIQRNPKAYLHDGVLFNICTLYELESSHCSAKKQNMLQLVSKYAADSFNVSCLKISPNTKA